MVPVSPGNASRGACLPQGCDRDGDKVTNIAVSGSTTQPYVTASAAPLTCIKCGKPLDRGHVEQVDHPARLTDPAAPLKFAQLA